MRQTTKPMIAGMASLITNLKILVLFPDIILIKNSLKIGD